MLKFLYQPVRPHKLNQRFGENNMCVSTDGANRVIGCSGAVPNGYKKLYGSNGHLGIDLKAQHGQEVYCALTGTISEIDTNPRTGLDVRVVSELGGKLYRHIYEHLLGYQGKIGDSVATGQLIGWADNTGYSSGDHLHFELQEWKNGKWVSVNPEPLMFSVFARDQLMHTSLLKWLSEYVAQHGDNLASWLRDAGRR